MVLTGTSYALFVGGKMGKFPRLGESLAVGNLDDDKLLDAVESVIDWYSANGMPRERFGDTLQRTGIEALTDYVSGIIGGSELESVEVSPSR
jgi:dissimilatory sulfite reductase (desulfoviridin) alpha/beta subunit